MKATRHTALRKIVKAGPALRRHTTTRLHPRRRGPPALKRLFADIEAGESDRVIDRVIGRMVGRLSRSALDIVRIREAFEGAGQLCFGKWRFNTTIYKTPLNMDIPPRF